MADHTIPRDRLAADAVECPLCRRQIAAPTEHLRALDGRDAVTAETADAVECPTCGGVSFLEPRPDG